MRDFSPLGQDLFSDSLNWLVLRQSANENGEWFIVGTFRGESVSTAIADAVRHEIRGYNVDPNEERQYAAVRWADVQPFKAVGKVTVEVERRDA